MTSCLLYHGPGARQNALDEAARLGRLLHEPFGEVGLKVDEARLLVSLMQAPPIGVDLGVVIAGPMDKAPPKSADVLLKVIEEPPDFVRPLLWATDLGGVRGTIRSRCLPVWCPTTGFEEGDDELEATARELLQAVLNERIYEIPIHVKKMKGRETELLAEVSEAMSSMPDVPAVLALWERVREVARWRNPTYLEVVAAFLPRKA